MIGFPDPPPVHVMLDLETLSTRNNAAIIQIAAVAFMPDIGPHVGTLFNAYIKDLHVSAHVDPATIAWWLQQRAAASLGAAIENKGGYLGLALVEFAAWYKGLGAVEAIWSHGATFDIPILAGWYQTYNMAIPWSYRAPRDTRTLYALAPGGMPSIGVDPERKHDALYDCEIQIKQVVGALAALRAQAENAAQGVKYLAQSVDLVTP